MPSIQVVDSFPPSSFVVVTNLMLDLGFVAVSHLEADLLEPGEFIVHRLSEGSVRICFYGEPIDFLI